jgi:hypothetical protein
MRRDHVASAKGHALASLELFGVSCLNPAFSALNDNFPILCRESRPGIAADARFSTCQSAAIFSLWNQRLPQCLHAAKSFISHLISSNQPLIHGATDCSVICQCFATYLSCFLSA